MSLRSFCIALSRKVELVDIIMQYCQLDMLLSPLCNVLNEWIHDEDQSESTVLKHDASLANIGQVNSNLHTKSLHQYYSSCRH